MDTERGLSRRQFLRVAGGTAAVVPLPPQMASFQPVLGEVLKG